MAFADERVRTAFQRLKSGRSEERRLAELIDRAIRELLVNPLAGVVVPRRLWPQEYVRRYHIANLRKYDLPEGWRLIYFLKGNEVEIITVLLEWFDHKGYEKRFGYHVK
ncbi:MAG: type II toxin-antitoxin system RelE/ParE family toxin [Candidatus Micrarchaeia archaeon]